MKELFAALLGPQFPDASDVAVELNNKDVREGFRELPDCPALNLSLVKEWHSDFTIYLTPNRYQA